MEKVRAVYEPQAFMPAIQTASSLGNPGISVQKMGLIVNAALMSPLLADDGTQGLILDGYEERIRRQPGSLRVDKSWAGDIWAFASWAKNTLPGFDSERPNIGFLPSPN
jgi:hypothetical protein